MVAQSKEASGTFRWQLAKQMSLADLEVWIRAADVYNEINAPVITTGFQSVWRQLQEAWYGWTPMK
jgi:hypothetical protein